MESAAASWCTKCVWDWIKISCKAYHTQGKIKAAWSAAAQPEVLIADKLWPGVLIQQDICPQQWDAETHLNPDYEYFKQDLN